MLNQRPDLRWRAEPLPELQLELLRAAAERTRSGGTIVYSVCTVHAQESEAVVDAVGLDVDSSLAEEWPSFRHSRRPEFLQTLPHVHGTAGFFIARLPRPEQRTPIRSGWLFQRRSTAVTSGTLVPSPKQVHARRPIAHGTQIKPSLESVEPPRTAAGEVAFGVSNAVQLSLTDVRVAGRP